MTYQHCPHVILANGKWQWFKNKVQAHLNAIKKGSTAPAKPVAKKLSSKAKWTTNTHGTQYLKTSGTWVNGSEPIMTRFHSPFQSAKQGG